MRGELVSYIMIPTLLYRVYYSALVRSDIKLESCCDTKFIIQSLLYVSFRYRVYFIEFMIPSLFYRAYCTDFMISLL